MQGIICWDYWVQIQRCLIIFEEGEERVVLSGRGGVHVEEQRQDTEARDAHCMGPEFLLWEAVKKTHQWQFQSGLMIYLPHDEFAFQGRIKLQRWYAQRGSGILHPLLATLLLGSPRSHLARWWGWIQNLPLRHVWNWRPLTWAQLTCKMARKWKL